ncbi:MAG: hypothetical protein ABSC41_19185 [Acidimicrobiales bacterium]
MNTESHPTIAERLRVNRRSLQVVLGVIWILDGLLKFQPALLKPDFVNNLIRPMSVGQPTVIASTINHMANFLSHEATMWVAVFGLAEIAIGAAMLSRWTVKRALVASFIWGGGVYLFGEGFGMVFTGHTSPLAGAPGAVCFYVLLGVMVWPKEDSNPDRVRMGVDSSAAGRGLLGGTGALLVWAAIWIVEALIWMLPANRAGNAITNQMSSTAAGEPGWYAHLLNSFGHAFTGAGVWVAVLLAAASIVIAIGPLISNRPEPFLGLGIALALGYWITGQGLGALLTLRGTDPSNGPIIALIGLSVLPLVPAREGAPTPAARLMSRYPSVAVLGVLGLVVVPLAVGVTPAGSELLSASGSGHPSGTVLAVTSGGTGNPMSAMSMSSSAHPTKTGTAHSMNMSAMAGLGVTSANWRYTGPPLPSAEINLLTVASEEQDKGHKMQTPNCTTAPTSQQVLGATQYVQAVSAAVAKYRNLSVAEAAGYVPITTTSYPVVHYLNVRYMNQSDILNPNAVDSLVYATTPYGPVLVAAMYLMPGYGNGPMPYGCLVQWHAHTNLCQSETTHQIDGLQPCRAGSTAEAPTPFMTHVWQVPVAGGPLAIDPSDLQVVEAAIMAQQEGLAPTTTGAPPVLEASAEHNAP